MVSTLDLMQEHQLETGLQGKLLEEEIAFLYTGIRLKPLITPYRITKADFDELCSAIVKQHIDNNYSLDCIINSIYNYVNTHKFYPPINRFDDDIEIFLKKYCVAIEDFTKRK